MNYPVKNPSTHTLRNLTLWVGIFTALVLLLVMFLQGSMLTDVPTGGLLNYHQVLDQFQGLTSAFVNSLKQIQPL